MPSYTIQYERQVNVNYSYWLYLTEEIKAQGIVHAHKLAMRHLKELRKMTNLPMRICRITQVEEIEDAD